MPKKKHSMRSGFSLIESIVVILIMGIVATMGFGYLVRARPHAQLERAELLITGSLKEARQLAISEEVATRVAFDLATSTYQLARQDRDSGDWTDVGVAVALPEGVTLSTVTLASSSASFTPRGTLVSGGDITLNSADSETRTLTGNLATGRFPVTGGNLR